MLNFCCQFYERHRSELHRERRGVDRETGEVPQPARDQEGRRQRSHRQGQTALGKSRVSISKDQNMCTKKYYWQFQNKYIQRCR